MQAIGYMIVQYANKPSLRRRDIEGLADFIRLHVCYMKRTTFIPSAIWSEMEFVGFIGFLVDQ